MNVKEILGAFLLVNNPIVLSEEETKDVQKAIKQLQQENKILKENAENNDKVVDKINWENQLLKTKIKNAIEYINKYENIKAYYEYIDEDEYDEYNYDEDFKEELIHILQGDKNQ